CTTCRCWRWATVASTSSRISPSPSRWKPTRPRASSGIRCCGSSSRTCRTPLRCKTNHQESLLMSLYNTFETDKSLERDGIVLDYGFNSKNQPIQIRIARAGGANTKFAKVLEQKMKPYKRAIANDTMDNKVAEKLMVEAYADAVILGWE